MLMFPAESLLLAVALYLIIGAAFGLIFVARWVDKLDPSTPGTRWTFRLLILPGVAAFWPWILVRCSRSRKGRHKP